MKMVNKFQQIKQEVMESDLMKDLRKGCKKDFGFFHNTKVKRFCGGKYPKYWIDERHKIKMYPVYYCFSCRGAIKRGHDKLLLLKLKKFAESIEE